MKDMLTPLLVALVVGGIVYVIDDRSIHPLLPIISMSRKNKRRFCFSHAKRTFYRRKSFLLHLLRSLTF
ncbi:hypothetical protein C6X95_12510 [Bacillus pumilus]|nr:hypothetical protein C6X95_12510 [Bacillus pumilus]